MSQPSVASYFNTRKRAAAEEINITRNKIFVGSPTIIDDNHHQNGVEEKFNLIFHQDNRNNILLQKKIQDNNNNDESKEEIHHQTRSGRSIKRIGITNLDKNTCDIIGSPIKQQKLVEFMKLGSLSPRKRLTPQKNGSTTRVINAFVSNKNLTNVERGMKTPTKQIQSSNDDNKKTLDKDLHSMVRKELNFDEVKTKVTRSAKLQELKASLGRLKELDKVRKEQHEKNQRLRKGEPATVTKPKTISLKEFKTIELEVLTSPKKGLKTPVKDQQPASQKYDKNDLMSPKKITPHKLIFSPTKDGSPAKVIQTTPTKLPAYQRYQHLIDAGRPNLQLPYKYRCLIEMFKCLDSVCAMFYNRKEIITFKKMKPAIQRMLRKNFNEENLAQIKFLYPESYQLQQMKMRNFGSISKQDYYQLVLIPNINGKPQTIGKIDEDNVLKSAQLNTMNPQIMLERQQKFTNILLNKVKDEHDKFLKTLDPPLTIAKDKITRWHPEFDLEKCPNIEKGTLPQPPNIEKYSSAKDILSTARNLFNCSTSIERAMERYENSNIINETNQTNDSQILNEKLDNNNSSSSAAGHHQQQQTMNLLKGVPKSLLEKIRAKQAAKALDSMTRRPSQDREAIKYSRLPELARYLRNVFITEKKSVLPLETIIKKIENSYRTLLTTHDIETHLRLIGKECEKWIVFHEIRKTIYIKMSKDINLTEIIEKLENLAISKSK